jgi:hypothetical protein
MISSSSQSTQQNATLVPQIRQFIFWNILTTLTLGYHLIIPCHKIRELKASLVKKNITQCLMNTYTFVFI